MRRWWLLPLATACLSAAPGRVGGQQQCDVTGTQEASYMGGIGYLRVARLACQDMRIRADSAMLYQESGIYQLFGRVFIDTPDVQLRARDAQYYPDQGLILAQGAVSLLRKQDSTSISNGETLTLYRAGAAGRAEDQLTIEGGRPHAEMRPPPAEGAEPDSVAAEPYVIDADWIEIQGQNVLRARGDVELTRGDLNAAADTLDYLSQSGQLLLTGDASLDVETYLLTGGMILVSMADDEIREIIGRRNARLIGDIEIEGGFIRLDLSDGELDGVTAGPDSEEEAASQPGGAAPQIAAGRPPLPTTGPAPADSTPPPPRARATSEDLEITSDHLDIELSASVIERLQAHGNARLVTFANDSLNTEDTPEVARRDWIEGDTIDAIFALPDSAATADSAAAAAPGAIPPAPDSVRTPAEREPEPDSAASRRPRLEVLIARVNARALYRLPAADTTNADDPACSGPGRFAVHYVVGDSITITMKDNEVDEMNVVGQVVGQHLEPPACGPGQPADTTQPADTLTSPAAPPPGAQPRPAPTGTPPRPPPPEEAGILLAPAPGPGRASHDRPRRARPQPLRPQ